MPPRRAPERLLAWFVTGPVGHLLSGLADVGELLVALTRARVREKRLGRGGG